LFLAHQVLQRLSPAHAPAAGSPQQVLLLLLLLQQNGQLS
jgi:hypothetical protein